MFFALLGWVRTMQDKAIGLPIDSCHIDDFLVEVIQESFFQALPHEQRLELLTVDAAISHGKNQKLLDDNYDACRETWPLCQVTQEPAMGCVVLNTARTGVTLLSATGREQFDLNSSAKMQPDDRKWCDVPDNAILKLHGGTHNPYPDRVLLEQSESARIGVDTRQRWLPQLQQTLLTRQTATLLKAWNEQKGDNDMLITQNGQLQTQNCQLQTQNGQLKRKNDELNDELKRQRQIDEWDGQPGNRWQQTDELPSNTRFRSATRLAQNMAPVPNSPVQSDSTASAHDLDDDYRLRD
jgi:hypothetical protein